MKKPVKPNHDTITAVVERRKNVKIKVVKEFKPCNIYGLGDQIREFATAQWADDTDIKFVKGYRGFRMEIYRTETSAEKYNRVKSDLDQKYYQNKFDYESWEREETYRKNMIAHQTPVHTVSVNCCSCKCK